MSLAAALRAWDELHSPPASDAGSLSSVPSTSTLEPPPRPRQRAPRREFDVAYGKFAGPEAGASKTSLRACIGLAPILTLRKHEHLAVLIDRSLWKSDKEARQCEVWNCETAFTLFERRHHCRKCGGVFCAAHSSRTTSLLDVSRLDIFHPPRGVPITDYESPSSPVVFDARVCDGCHDLLHGIPSWPSAAAAASASTSSSPASPQDSLASLPSPSGSTTASSVRMRARARRTQSPQSRSSASTSSLASTPRDDEPLALPPPPGLTRGIRWHATAPPTASSRSVETDSRPSRSGSLSYFPVSQQSEPKPAPADMLTAYPLHEHSSQCKRRASDRRRLLQRTVF